MMHLVLSSRSKQSSTIFIETYSKALKTSLLSVTQTLLDKNSRGKRTMGKIYRVAENIKIRISFQSYMENYAISINVS